MYRTMPELKALLDELQRGLAVVETACQQLEHGAAEGPEVTALRVGLDLAQNAHARLEHRVEELQTLEAEVTAEAA